MRFLGYVFDASADYFPTLANDIKLVQIMISSHPRYDSFIILANGKCQFHVHGWICDSSAAEIFYVQ